MAKLIGWKCKECGDYLGFYREDDAGSFHGVVIQPTQCTCGSTEFTQEDLTHGRDN